MALLTDVKVLKYNISTVMRGVSDYKKTGVTPHDAYLVMRNLYCDTRGWSNDLIGSLVKANESPYALASTKGVLGEPTATDLERITGELNQNGYYMFPNRLPEDLIDRMTRFALSTEAMLRPAREDRPPKTRYDRSNPETVAYHFEEQTLFNNKDVQDLASDLSMVAIAQSYLGTKAILDGATMWWSTAFTKDANSEVAQQFHFDLDRLKFLKFFMYLTDVTEQSGPHVYVAKSHRNDGKPDELRKRGPVRIPDEDIEKHYPKQDIIKVCGPRGSIFAGDTRAFHKGTVVESGDRLVFELEFCNSLFGAPYNRIRLNKQTSPQLLEAVKRYPVTYSKFSID